MVAIKGFLSMTWTFLMNTYIPGTDIAFGVMFVGIAMIGIGFRFLSLAIGHSIGEIGGVSGMASYGSSGSNRYRITDGRKNDVR